MFDRFFPYFVGGSVVAFIALRVWGQPIFDNPLLSIFYHAVTFAAAFAALFLALFAFLKVLAVFFRSVPGIFVLVYAAFVVFAAAYAKLKLDDVLDSRYGDEKEFTTSPSQDDYYHA